MSPVRKVLVIDDERVVCNSCGRALRQEGYKVSVATDGQAAIEKASHETFDVIIVDLKMPGLCGMDVLRTLRRKMPEARVVVITGFSSVASEIEARQLGASDYLPKPFTPKELTETMERVFRTGDHSHDPPAKTAMSSDEFLSESVTDHLPEEAFADARILLANNNRAEMMFLREALSSEPWQLRTASRHEDVIESIQKGQSDILIIGVEALGRKVYEFIPEVRKLGGNIPIIVASGDPSLELARRVRELGIFFYLMEPFDQDEVRAVVRDAVKKALMTRKRAGGPPPKPPLVRCVRTITRHGSKVGLVITGEWVDQKSGLYREIVEELKRRYMPMHTALAPGAISARELPPYLEQDDKVIIVAASENTENTSPVVTYSAEEFESSATEQQRRTLKGLAYPEVLYWLEAQGVTPNVKIFFFSGDYLAAKGTPEAARIIINEVVA